MTHELNADPWQVIEAMRCASRGHTAAREAKARALVELGLHAGEIRAFRAWALERVAEGTKAVREYGADRGQGRWRTPGEGPTPRRAREIACNVLACGREPFEALLSGPNGLWDLDKRREDERVKRGVFEFASDLSGYFERPAWPIISALPQVDDLRLVQPGHYRTEVARELREMAAFDSRRVHPHRLSWFEALRAALEAFADALADGDLLSGVDFMRDWEKEMLKPEAAADLAVAGLDYRPINIALDLRHVCAVVHEDPQAREPLEALERHARLTGAKRVIRGGAWSDEGPGPSL